MPNEEIVRIMACASCGTVEELPDFQGPPQYDELLAVAAAKHAYPSGERHIGQLFRVPEKAWHVVDTREQVIKQIQARLNPDAETGLPSAAYAMVNNFRDDAMACFAQHNRNANCSDYKSDAKRLVPDTADARRELGLSPARAYDAEDKGLTRYLCEYCPVHSMVQQANRKKAGLYDK